jgi:hypothetical protein
MEFLDMDYFINAPNNISSMSSNNDYFKTNHYKNEYNYYTGGGFQDIDFEDVLENNDEEPTVLNTVGAYEDESFENIFDGGDDKKMPDLNVDYSGGAPATPALAAAPVIDINGGDDIYDMEELENQTDDDIFENINDDEDIFVNLKSNRYVDEDYLVDPNQKTEIDLSNFNSTQDLGEQSPYAEKHSNTSHIFRQDSEHDLFQNIDQDIFQNVTQDEHNVKIKDTTENLLDAYFKTY